MVQRTRESSQAEDILHLVIRCPPLTALAALERVRLGLLISHLSLLFAMTGISQLRT